MNNLSNIDYQIISNLLRTGKIMVTFTAEQIMITNSQVENARFDVDELNEFLNRIFIGFDTTGSSGRVFYINTNELPIRYRSALSGIPLEGRNASGKKYRKSKSKKSRKQI